MKFLNLNKSYGYVLTTLLFLVFFGAIYFFIYLPKNEKRIEEQRFRTLQNIDGNIHEKIGNSLSLIRNILNAYVKDTANKHYLADYIAQYPKDKFEISQIYATDAKSKKPFRDSLLNVPSLLVNDATKEIFLQLQRHVNNKNDTTIIQCSIGFSFKQFIENLLPQDVFDEYVVFSKNRTVYESFPSGIINPREDSLFSIRNGVNGSYARDIAVGGKDYKVFLQPVSFDNNNKWILGGLLSNNRYQEERSALPAGIVMLLVTMVLVMIVIFPWIKLYQMGSKDRLTLMDGASSIVVSMLLMSLLFFCFFKYNVSIRGNDSPDSKHFLASKISSAFYSETRNMYNALSTYDTFKNNKQKYINLVNLEDTNISCFDSRYKYSSVDINTKKEIDSLKKEINNKLNNNCKKEFYWLNKEGVETYNWTTDKYNAPHGDFKTRNYFNNIENNNPYYLDGDFKKKFYLDQVVSWYTGTFTSVISVPSVDPSNSVAALSFTMRSVQDVVLPTGYSFAIIDANGKVLYHSVSSRNLKENLKSEFSDSVDIVGCINARAEGNFNTRYYSKNYSVSIAPLNNLPYFIVILSDTSYKDLRDVETYSFTFSMLLLLFLFIVLQLSITILISSRHSFFKKQLFDTSWIGPKLSCHEDYVLSSINNLVVIAILILFFQRMAFLPYLFLVLLSVTYIALFINMLFLRRYWKEGKVNNLKYKKTAVGWLSIMLVVINFSASVVLENDNFFRLVNIEKWALVFGVFILFCTVFFVKRLYKKVVKKLPSNYKIWLSDNIKKSLLADNNYIRSFAFMILTGLVITSGIPVAFFYVTSYNYEQNLGIRHRQTDYAKRLLAKQPSEYNIKTHTINYYNTTDAIYKNYGAFLLKEAEGLFKLPTPKDIIRYNGTLTKSFDSIVDRSNSFIYTYPFKNDISNITFDNYDKTGIYYDGSWINSYPLIVDYSGINIKYDSAESYKTRKLLGIFHLTIGDKTVKTDKLYVPYAADTSIIYQPLIINTNADSSYVSTYEKLDIEKKYLKLTSFNLNYIVPAVFKSKTTIFYWILLCVAFVVFYFIINNIIKKLFCSNLPDLDTWKELDTKLITNNKLNKLLFVIGLPGSGKKDIILKKIEKNELEYNGIKLVFEPKGPEEKNVFIADLINMPDTGAAIENDPNWKRFCWEAMNSNNKLVIINHFEYNILDEYTNVAKLNLLEQLMLKNTSKIIILSTIHPTSFLDSINDINRKTNTKPGHDLERWNVLLGHYRIALMPIATNETEMVPSWKQLISKETDYTHFLKDMKELAFEVIDASLKEKNVMVKADELAYKLQVTAHYFYMYIWQSLTKEEKFLLYDLAEDNLVNSYDDYNLTMLIAKGVIVKINGSLQLFNKGFRNFILTAIGSTEAMKIKDRIKENGNWSNLKTPLLIVIMAILAFLLISQQEAYSKLLTYVAALTAGVPTILKIFSLFDKNATKSNT